MNASDTRRIYRSARLVDGLSEAPVQDAALMVDGNRIVWVGPATQAPADMPTIDLGDATLLPGLIDCHVHLVWDASAAPHEVVARATPERTALRAAAQARRHLDAGETSIRDVGASYGVSIPLAEAIEAGDVIGPRIIAAGCAITMTEGHAWFLGREADGPDAVRAAVRSELKAGASCINRRQLHQIDGVRGCLRDT